MQDYSPYSAILGVGQGLGQVRQPEQPTRQSLTDCLADVFKQLEESSAIISAIEIKIDPIPETDKAVACPNGGVYGLALELRNRVICNLDRLQRINTLIG